MKKPITFLSVCLLVSCIETYAQGTLDKVLDSINSNNKSISANKEYNKSRKLEFKTNLNPNNPYVEYDRLNGSPAGAGVQKDFAVTQSFDFPTTYVKRRQVSKEQTWQSELEEKAFRQDILFKGEITFLELVYLNKQNMALQLRLGNVNHLYNNFQKKFDIGESNILDLNKVKMQLTNLKNEHAFNESKRRQYLERLAELNGGKRLEVTDTLYPAFPEVLPYIEMDSIIEANDALLKVIVQEKEITEKEVQLSRSLTLPKMEAGYHYQSILGQRYQGVHLGMSIPLWQDANKVKQQKAELTYNEKQIENHRTIHIHEIRELYSKYEHLKSSLQEYEHLMKNANNEKLLEKALLLGEISTIEYFMELTLYYGTYDKYLSIQRDYYQVIAELYKFQL
jgi:outer membrane protein, heavy metal efflux system